MILLYMNIIRHQITRFYQEMTPIQKHEIFFVNSQPISWLLIQL